MYSKDVCSMDGMDGFDWFVKKGFESYNFFLKDFFKRVIKLYS